MNLQEFLGTLPDDQKIRVGCRPGCLGDRKGGFIYQGRVDGFKSWELEQKYINQLIEQMTKHMSWKVPNKSAKRKLLQNVVDRYCEIVPFWKREVLEFYHGQFEPEVIVVIVPGHERFFDYKPKNKLKTFEDSAVEGLIEAVYKSLISELVTAKDEGHAQALALTIHKNEYGYFSNPQGILDACRKERRRRYGE